jgi:16S rRNA (guanine527-N7)-methyltransferase
LTEINKFFPKLNQEKKEKYNKLIQLYKYWNLKVNLISRKDINNLEINHILHSLSIVKIVRFKDSTLVMDVGTGGGLPGIPLAIFFPKVNFTLIDSIGKKIKVVKSICSELSINNVNAINDRVENHFDHYDFVLSRAVTRMDKFYKLVNKNFRSNSSNKIKNGIISLKGGTLYEELKDFNEKKIYDVNKFFNHEFFQTKKIIHIPFQK